jgi:hypothetical protein
MPGISLSLIFEHKERTLKRLFENESTQIIVFVAVILVSRVPFLFSGYGLDADAWEVALTAKNISSTGIYDVSRFPGYPVHEILCSLFYTGSYVSLNLLSTIISTVGFIFFVSTLKALRFKSVFLAAFALASVKTIYIHSTVTIDYTWALAFILVALYFVVKDKPVVAGLFLGIAIGCRITSGAMLLPFAIMISQTDGLKKNIVRITKLTIVTLLMGSLLFLPVFMRYGMSFLTYYDIPYPSIPEVLFKFSAGVWGVIGFLGIIIATCLLLLPIRSSSKNYLFPRSVNEKFVVSWLIAIDLYIIAFLKLPMEEGYLIPIIPFVILIFGKYLYDRAFTFLCITLIISPLVTSITPENRGDPSAHSPFAFNFEVGHEHLVFDPLIGPVFAYQSRREKAMEFTSHVLEVSDSIKNKTLIIAGRWYTQLMVRQPESSSQNVKFIDYINTPKLLKYSEDGYQLFYLPLQDHDNFLKYGIDVKAFGALPFTDQVR